MVDVSDLARVLQGEEETKGEVEMGEEAAEVYAGWATEVGEV